MTVYHFFVEKVAFAKLLTKSNKILDRSDFFLFSLTKIVKTLDL